MSREEEEITLQPPGRWSPIHLSVQQISGILQPRHTRFKRQRDFIAIPAEDGIHRMLRQFSVMAVLSVRQSEDEDSLQKSQYGSIL